MREGSVSVSSLASLPGSIDGVCEVRVHAAGAPSAPWLLIEVPHGATRRADYERVAADLVGPLPADLIHFFYVNTDVGAPEGAAWLAQRLASRGWGVVTLRCAIPRTFIDTNRALSDGEAGLAAATAERGRVHGGLTAAIPAYLRAPADLERLAALHRDYHRVARHLYEAVGTRPNGYLLQLHSFAPKSVGIEMVDEHIVEALHAAYEPAAYARWPERPTVDLICASADGAFAPAARLVARVEEAYRAAGIAARRNATYAMSLATMGTAFARTYPDRMLCVELNRGAIGAPFVPFGETTIDEEALASLVQPIEAALLADAASTPSAGAAAASA
jgi:hypothetical protein